MDLRVSQRLVRPGLDSNMLAPPHTLFLGHFSSEPFPRVSPSHVEVQCVHEPSPAEMDDWEKLRQLMHKNKNEQSAVASPLVKQILRERIIMKKVAQERSSPSHTSPTPRGYRELGPDPDMPPKPKPSLSDRRQELVIRRTVSEPTLKLKLKKHISTRQSPLQRKASAPPAVKHRTHDAFDSSPNSSTPVSGCSSPNDSLLSENGTRPLTTGLVHEANRLLLQSGSLAYFSMASSSTGMPTITAGLPAQVDRHQGGLMGSSGLQVSALSHIYLPLEGLNPARGQRLQPVLVLEPHTGLLHPQLLSVHGLSALPQQLQQQLRPHQLLLPSEGGGGAGGGDDSRWEEGPASHRPLIRTRSEPPPYSHSPLASPGPQEGPHHQRLLPQYHNSLLLERLKHQAHLGKLISKPSEKPRLTQIPSEDMDLEETGSGSGSGPGSLCGSEPGSLGEERHLRRRQSAASTDSVYDTESNASSRESLVEHPHALAQTLRWEPHRQAGMRRPVAQLEPLALPVLIGPHHRPLSRAQSSPAATSTPPALLAALPLTSPEPPVKLRFTTGLVYDTQMQKHQCACGDNSHHPEHAGRVQSIWSRLRGLRKLCEHIRSRKATLEELQSVHSETHVVLYGTNPFNRFKLDSNKLAAILSQRTLKILPCGGVGTDSDTVWNETHTATASRLAAGCVTELALKVAQGELKNGFAVVRPPGHHATHSAPMGFCFFNTVAIAAKQLQLKLNVSKILIVDWDVHHGNGTQEAFYNDPSVLYISLHRYDNRNFFPGSGGPTEMGAGKGEGFNVNVAWTGGLDPPMGDVEYLAAFRTVVMPIAHEFSPDMVLVSSGFDAVQGHSPELGGYKVSAKCFGYLTHQLMSLAGGRVVLALEGGHDLTAICDASEACVSTLLGMEVEALPQSVLEGRPCDNAILALQRVIQVHGEYWQSVRSMAPTLQLSHLQAQRLQPRRDLDSAMASLSMGVLSPNR